MCGIVGIFDLRGSREIDANVLHRMNETQHHRGPDEGEIYREPGVGFGHRRLSIIDVASGQQPLFNEDRSVVVVFNGEIYNFQELVPELQARGHVFRTHSDTEVIVHGWEEWGEDCVKRLRGMFAFAVWDRNRKTMFIARDRLGIKPFFYAELPNGLFVFGSELKSIYAHKELARDIDPQAVEDYFAFGYIPEPRTILRGARKLLPGHTLTVRAGQTVPASKEYWDVPFAPTVSGGEDDVGRQVIEHLREAVQCHLMSEVPLGAFLSGGVDSSAVVAMMAQIDPSKPVNTCSIGFGDPKYNETEFAQLVATRYKTDHHVEQVNPDDFALIDKLAFLYDEPYADSSAIPTYRVCELARKRVTVALSGDGGDEDFAGYRRHRWHMNEESIRARVPLALRRLVFGPLGALYPKLDWAPKILRAKTTFQSLARDSLEAYMHTMSILHDNQRRMLYSERMKRDLQGYSAVEVFRHYARKAPTDHPLSLIQYLDLKTYLPGDILTKVDRASMAHALEVRVPILDHKFVEWVCGIAPELKLRGQEGKYIFKKALEPHLPNDVLYRPKMGFAVPLAGWFRGPLKQRVRESLLGPTLRDTGLFDMGYVERLVDEHQSGVGEHSAALWSLLMFESFARTVMRG
jgi:asparagine synthase (glutamine-hydrolysing)